MTSTATTPDAPRTPWFDGAARPAHEGVYERRGDGARFACWNGRYWNDDAPDPAGAARQRVRSATQRRPWRGLSEPSNEPCATCRGHGIVDGGYDVEAANDLIAECVDCPPE